MKKTPFGTRGYGEIVVHDGKMWHLGKRQGCLVDDRRRAVDVRHAGSAVGSAWASAVAVHARKALADKGSATPRTRAIRLRSAIRKFTTHNDVWCSRMA